MARRRAAESERDLRAHLLAAAVELRQCYGSADTAYWLELSKPVEQLESGREYSLRRSDLPGDHPSRQGDPNQLLVLGVDDVLRVDD